MLKVEDKSEFYSSFYQSVNFKNTLLKKTKFHVISTEKKN